MQISIMSHVAIMATRSIAASITSRDSYYPCVNYYMDLANPDFLYASCPDIDNTAKLTHLDLNKCLWNNKGDLEFVNGGGDGMKSCEECNVLVEDEYYASMTCHCLVGEGDKTKKETIDLMEQVYNSAGVLACYNTLGIRE